MRATLALSRVTLRLAARERSVIFFNYAFPLIFFFGFGEFLGGKADGATMTRIVSMVIVIGLLGSGLFGSGLRAVFERETGILRRYKVTPITPVPILIASLITGWLLYLPSAVLVVVLAHYIYQMPWPTQPVSLFFIVTLGSFAFRSLGLIIAAVANSMAESNILIQIFYMPMLFLSGATIPISALPATAQIIAQFLPASYVNSGIQHVLLREQSLASRLDGVAALLVTAFLGIFISSKIFRWEKEEKLRASAKGWVVAVLVPFLLVGGYQAWSRDHLDAAKQLDRQIRRNHARYIRGATLFLGDGNLIKEGVLLVRNGRIEGVYSSASAPPPPSGVEVIEAAGKVILPGLIDAQVSLAGLPLPRASRTLAAFLYCGVTAVRSIDSPTPDLMPLRDKVNSGAQLGAELFFSTAPEQGAFSAHLPALAVHEARAAFTRRNAGFLDRSLVSQAAPPEELAAARRAVEAGESPSKISLDDANRFYSNAEANLRAAWLAGVPLAAGSGAGNLLLFHGPSLHRELQLWVRAGIPPAVALQAATANAARLLGVHHRLGLLKPGYDATIVALDGNPLEDISATERVSFVLFKGEWVDRSEILTQPS